MSDRRIQIIDDHPLLAAALRHELERSGIDVEMLDPIGSNVDDLLGAVSTTAPDCVVVDLGLPLPGGGLALIDPLVAAGVRVVVLTGESERQLLATASGAGAEAVLSKAEPLTEIVETILQVTAGQKVRASQRAELAAELQRITNEQNQLNAPFAELSKREQEVLAGLMDGQQASMLAEQNYVSVGTVRSQIKSLLCKLGVSSQLQAVALAHRNRWTPAAPDGE